MECDFVHCRRTSLARCARRPSDRGEGAERSRCDGRSANHPAALWRPAIQRSAESQCAWRRALREPTQPDQKSRRFGRRTVGRRSLARASRHRPASPEAAAGRSPNARRGGEACIVSDEKSWRAVEIRHFAKIGGAGENVVARIVSVGAEMMSGPQSGVCLWHDLHQPDCALWRHGAWISAAPDAHHRPNPVHGNIESLRGLRDESCERKSGAEACRASDRSWLRARSRRTTLRSTRRPPRRRSQRGLSASALAYSDRPWQITQRRWIGC
jgi:hypothetical protein